MKNGKKKISSILLGLLILVVLTGCFSKKALTSKEFITVMKDKNFDIYDISSTYSSYGYIGTVILAKSKEDYQLGFYTFDDENYATEYFNINKGSFDSLEGDSSSKAQVEAGNYSTYALTKAGKYMYLSRVDNTLLYIDVDVKHKTEVKNIVEELGY